MPRGTTEVCFSVNQNHRNPENGVKQLNARKQGNWALFNCCSWLQPTSGYLEKQHTCHITSTNLTGGNKETKGVIMGVVSRRGREEKLGLYAYQRVGSILSEG